MTGNDNNVTKERHRWTKAEKQYIKSIVHNYSLQRWTDQDIVNYLQNEKKIKIARSTVTTIKNQVVEEAGDWYLELRESGTKTIAFFKERLDSLLSYQKKLNEILTTCEVPEIRIRAIAELHRIEMSLHTIFQELPHDQFQIRPEIEREPKQCDCFPTGTITHSKCRYCKQVWCPMTLKQDWCPNPECSHGIKGCKFRPYDEHHEWVKCSTCEMWFKTPDIMAVHKCYIIAVPAIEGDDGLPGPGIGGEGAGPIVEESPNSIVPEPEPEIITSPSSPLEERTQIEEEEPEETEADRYWRNHPARVKPTNTNNNKVKFIVD
jgi:hypothetical protein